jgi:dTDP-4-dehydrorhamnose 3,5-epimerase
MEKFKHLTFKDHRGSYTPISTNSIEKNWIQCSVSVNDAAYTFRGLHYQTQNPQTKYVKVVKGKIIDFMVDLGTHETDFCLVDENEAVLIPNNKAHGFLTLEPNTIVVYMVDDIYNPQFEKSIVWNKIPQVKKIIEENVENFDNFVISDKDAIGK